MPISSRSSTCSERTRLVLDIATNTEIGIKQHQGWVNDAVRITSAVADGVTDLAPLFWIRVYGVLWDIKNQTTKSLEMPRQAQAAGRDISQSWAAHVWAAQEQILKSIDALGGLFTEDELIYFEYRRHTESHPLQHKYRLKVRKNGLSNVMCNLVPGKPQLSVEEANAALDRVLRQYPHEVALATEWAGRCLSQLRATAAAVDAWVQAGM